MRQTYDIEQTKQMIRACPKLIEGGLLCFNQLGRNSNIYLQEFTTGRVELPTDRYWGGGDGTGNPQWLNYDFTTKPRAYGQPSVPYCTRQRWNNSGGNNRSSAQTLQVLVNNISAVGTKYTGSTCLGYLAWATGIPGYRSSRGVFNVQLWKIYRRGVAGDDLYGAYWELQVRLLEWKQSSHEYFSSIDACSDPQIVMF